MKVLLSILIALACASGANAVTFDRIRFHNETTDTSRINNILIEATGKDFSRSGDCIAWLGNKFADTPYVAKTLENDSPQEEMLTVNLDEFDCTTFVETVLAMAYTVGERRSSWRDFVHNLEQIRYRGGNIDGYASRLHYISDWAVDNAHRGIIEDATRLFPKVDYTIKSLNFMSSNRNLYPALANDTVFENMKSVEVGYRNHRFPYIKARNVTAKENRQSFRNGDIVAFTTAVNGLDVSHIGIIVMKGGKMHLMHASSSAGKVVTSTWPIEEIFRKNRNMTGLRVFRLKDW